MNATRSEISLLVLVGMRKVCTMVGLMVYVNVMTRGMYENSLLNLFLRWGCFRACFTVPCSGIS